MANDLCRKIEKALAARFKQHPLLAKVRFRLNSEDSPKVNGDIVIAAKQGNANPPFSGVYEMAITVTLQMLQKKTVNTLPQFLQYEKAIEEVFDTDNFLFARQISGLVENFHCYLITSDGEKDNTPEENNHSSIWPLRAIAMNQTYAIAEKLQTQS